MFSSSLLHFKGYVEYFKYKALASTFPLFACKNNLHAIQFAIFFGCTKTHFVFQISNYNVGENLKGCTVY